MKWKNADEFFPLGYATLPTGEKITNEELKKSDYQTMIHDARYLARQMVTKEERYFWGDEGEFYIHPLYDVYQETPHIDNVYYPLSVYGQKVINDYVKLNNIQLD